MAKSRRHVLYGIVSFLCPIVAVVATDAYQSVYYPAPDYEPGYAYVGAMWGIAVAVQMLLTTLLGCLVGLAFAAISVLINRRFFSIGTAALAFNALPLAVALFFVIKGMTVGL